MTIDQIEALDSDFKIVPPEYEATAFLAYAQGWAKAKEKADREAEARRSIRTGEATGAVQPGGNLVLLFPDGRVRIRPPGLG